MTEISAPLANEPDTALSSKSTRTKTADATSPSPKANGPEGAAAIVPAAIIPHVAGDAGDGANRFLLCALIRESAKLIQVKADRAGEHLPMKTVVRGVLVSYSRASEETPGMFAGPGVDWANLNSLNDRILREQISRQTQQRVRYSRALLVHANRLGDETRIHAAEDDVERAVSARDRIAGALK